MQTIITQGFTLDQLLEAMRPMIRHELAHAHPSSSDSTMPVDDLLTVKQAAELLDVSVATIHEHKRTGKFPFTKLGGRVYIKRLDLMNAGTQQQRTIKPARSRSK